MEFKTYMEFHKQLFPKGKLLTEQDIIKGLNLTEKETKRIPLIYEYLKSRKVVKKTKEGKFEIV